MPFGPNIMHIIRFTDPDNQTHWGIPENDGQARLIEGDLFGACKPGETLVSIKQILAPLAPTAIYGIGLNYRDHAKETGADLPDYPIVFMKPGSAVSGIGDPIPIPACCARGPEVDYEAELAVIVGKVARNVRVDDALTYVFGYTVANDVSARRWQKHAGGKQWVRSKSFDGFCPLGPHMVTADEIPNPQALKIQSILNGTVMQDGTTSDMIFSVAEIISFLSEDNSLQPGTVILTGTPAGVGVARKPPVFLKAGDQIDIQIESLGTLSNPVIDPS